MSPRRGGGGDGKIDMAGVNPTIINETTVTANNSADRDDNVLGGGRGSHDSKELQERDGELLELKHSASSWWQWMMERHDSTGTEMIDEVWWYAA